ncbi:MAG TPA: TIR domain-containing protein [Bacteroidia bacterium]|jgi:hypothetical protein|nr:TIR domain-containing protein [Bacteroidia bacterium]
MELNNKRPYVFIGSSKEGLEYAKAIQVNLEYSCESEIWHQGLFGLSDGTLESLVSSIQNFDFAILIITGDDITISRGFENKSPRDNVIFELGLFMGGLGRDRVFFVVDRSVQPKLPSDLAGITPASFQQPELGTPQSALGAACTLIEQKIKAVKRKNKIVESLPKSQFETDFLLISTYLVSKNLSAISFEGLLANIDPRLSKEYVIELISKYPKEITRCKLKGNKEGIRLIKEPTNSDKSDRVPTELKASIEKYRPNLLGPNELNKFLQAIFSHNYDFFTIQSIRDNVALSYERILQVMNHLLEHGFCKKEVGYDGLDYWRLNRTPIRIYSATYEWENKKLEITDKVEALVQKGVLTGTVVPDFFGIGDPCYGVPKTLKIHYRYFGKETSKSFNDYDVFSLN